MNQINSSQFYGNLTSFPFFYLNWKFSHLELCVFIGLSTIRWGRTPRNGSITAFEQKFMKSINFKIKSVTNGVETFPNNFGKYVPHLKLERLTAIFNRSDMLRNDRLPCDYCSSQFAIRILWTRTLFPKIRVTSMNEGVRYKLWFMKHLRS